MLLETRMLPPGHIPLPSCYVSHQDWNQAELPLTAPSMTCITHSFLQIPISPGGTCPGEGRARAQAACFTFVLGSLSPFPANSEVWVGQD